MVADQITMSLNGEQEIRFQPTAEGTPGGYLHSFMLDLEGTLREGDLSTQDVLRAARCALRVQQAADHDKQNIDLHAISKPT
jgi:hypothetical protein